MKYGYTAVYPPFLMNKDIMVRTAQLEDFDESLYHVSGEDKEGKDDKYLIATSEQPISAMYYDTTLTDADLPLKYAGISTCLRKEAGSHGKDACHQFEKIEQFVYCKPSKSIEIYEEMLQIAELFYQSLNLPYQIVNIVSGELNNAAAKKYDLEAYFPTLKRYCELVSASNSTDYQSRGMNTKYGYPSNKQIKQGGENDTLVATTRTMCCILENYQTSDGIIVPVVLRPHCQNITFFPFKRPPPENKEKVDQLLFNNNNTPFIIDERIQS